MPVDSLYAVPADQIPTRSSQAAAIIHMLLNNLDPRYIIIIIIMDIIVTVFIYIFMPIDIIAIIYFVIIKPIDIIIITIGTILPL